MNKKLIYFATLISLVFLSGCVYSLRPIYTESTVRFEKSLLGRWQSEDGKTSITLENPHWEAKYQQATSLGNGSFRLKDGQVITEESNFFASIYLQDANKPDYTPPTDRKDSLDDGALSYFITLTSKEGTFHYLGHLAQIGGSYYLDLTADPLRNLQDNQVYRVSTPVHSFVKLNLQATDGAFSLTQFDLARLRDLFDANRIRLRHEDVDGEVLITASSEEMQQFLKTYGEQADVYEGTERFVRIVD